MRVKSRRSFMTMAAPRPEARAEHLSYKSLRRLGGVYDTQRLITVAWVTTHGIIDSRSLMALMHCSFYHHCKIASSFLNQIPVGYNPTLHLSINLKFAVALVGWSFSPASFNLFITSIDARRVRPAHRLKSRFKWCAEHTLQKLHQI